MRILKSPLIFAFLLIVLAVCAFVRLPITEYTYEGIISFDSEGDYSEFKQFLADNVISLRDSDSAPTVIVLSSDPPIVVDYIINVSAETDFPFSYDKQYASDNSINNKGFMAFAAAAFVYMLFLVGIRLTS